MSHPWIVDVPLPDYARVDLAFQDQRFLASPALGAAQIFSLTGGFILLLQSVSFGLVTSATVANRIGLLQIFDGTGAALIAVPSPTATPANGSSTMRWLGSASAAYTTGATTDTVAPLIPIALYPGWQVTFTATNLQAGDQINVPHFSAIFIPTGPAIDAGVPPIVHPVTIPVTGLAA